MCPINTPILECVVENEAPNKQQDDETNENEQEEKGLEWKGGSMLSNMLDTSDRDTMDTN